MANGPARYGMKGNNDMASLESDLRAELAQRGADQVYVVDISALPGEQRQGLPRAILLVMALTPGFLRDISAGLPPGEHDEFVEKEHAADALADWLAGELARRGFRALSQSEEANFQSGRFDGPSRSSALPHKTIARLAGLGFIGKNDLLVTQEYGCALVMCTVLTDAPLVTQNSSPRDVECGECVACVQVCPAQAISGETWTESGGRDVLVDVWKCTCGLKCMLACPWTVRYVGLENGTCE